MNIYEARIRLSYCEEFAQEYIALIKKQAEAAADKVADKYGSEAKDEIMNSMAEYIEYALRVLLQKKI